MSFEWPDDSTVVNRLVVRDVPGDKVRLRLRTESALNSVSLRSAGLSRESILCIKSLSDPLPGTLELSMTAALNPAPWEHAFAMRIGEIARSASHPIREAVPANATAVVFNDRAELLASLALDQADGELASRWWWRAIFRGLVPERVVAREWLKHSGSIPGALEHLARRGEIRRFVITLGEADVNRLLREMAVKFALDYLRPVFDSLLHLRGRTEFSDGLRSATEGQAAEDVQRYSQTLPFVQQIPWTKWLPEIDFDGLELEARALVGVGLMLYRAPFVVRSNEFAREIIRWFRSEQLSKSPRSARLSPGLKIADVVRWSGSGERSSGDLTQRARPMMRPRLAAEKLSREDGQKIDFDIRPPESRHGEGTHFSDGSHSPATADVGGESPPSFVQVSDRICGQIVSQERIETELGGLFYLINVAISMELYDDFTSPLDQGLSMPVWDFIELVGRRMLRGRYRHDPVWKLLARLSGRTERESPGMYFDPPHEWRIPTDWLRPFSSRSVWTWSVHGGRLRVRHREGFDILDIAGMRSPEKLLHRELSAYNAAADFALRRGYLRPTAVPPMERWLDWVVPFILARLRSAFGLSMNRDVIGRLLRHHAEIIAGEERIDVNFVLASLPVAIRISGLDRDPGWVPAGGKTIAFHYE